MQIVKIIFVAAALLVVVGQYLQELQRLAVIKRLTGPEGRAYYERTRERNERLLTAVTIGLATIAAGAVIRVFVIR